MDRESVTCPECGIQNEAHSDFCVACGAFLSWGDDESRGDRGTTPTQPSVTAVDPWVVSLWQDMASNGLWLVVGYAGKHVWHRLRRRFGQSTPAADEAERAAIQRVRVAAGTSVKVQGLEVVRTSVPTDGPAIVDVRLAEDHGTTGRMLFVVEVLRRGNRLEARIAETRR